MATQLMARADLAFAEQAVPRSALALWRPRFLSAAQWFVEQERERADDIVKDRAWKLSAA